MNSCLVLDSSVWIELFNKGPLHKECTNAIKNAQKITVPTLILFEVYKKIAACRSEDQALAAIALLSQHDVVDMTREIALAAADIALQKGLAMANSIVLAHAQLAGALLLTLDNDFADIADVHIIRQ
ncbi:type II toxin-antitoxin system VapC family toxin [Bdellovibrionota bacterium FG-2]